MDKPRPVPAPWGRKEWDEDAFQVLRWNAYPIILRDHFNRFSIVCQTGSDRDYTILPTGCRIPGIE
jgi:hypothetical protein